MHASARFSSSSASSKKVIAGISDAVARSSYRPLCGKTHLGSLSAQDPPKVYKRLSKEERRARVEEFVENYRASHEGKFPSATYVRKQVGGSYYVAWSLLQELEYDSRLGSDVRDASFKSENFKGRHGLNNIDLSIRDARTSFEDTKDLPEVQKRVTKEETRARVEEFVENFRASHEGKFPRATYVREQVGGSYYTVLALLQELEYNSRLKNGVKNASFNSENFKEKYGLHNMDLFTKEEMAKTLEPLDSNTKPQLSECHGKTGAAKPNLSSTTCLEDKSEPMASDQTDSNNTVKAQNLKSPKHAHEASKGINLWGSLKSFAGGLRIFWNNM